MGEFNILLWQRRAKYKNLESSMGKTLILSIVQTVQSSSVGNAFSSLYQSCLLGSGEIYNSVVINTVIHGSCCTLTV